MKKFKNRILKGTILIAILSILFTFSNMFFTFASDEIAPKIESIAVLKGTYQDGQTINFNVKFSEDVVLTRTADAGIVYVSINNPDLTGISYTYNSEDFSITIRKNEGITLTYSVLDETGSGIEIEQFTTSNITEFSLIDLNIKDLNGNALDVENLPNVSKQADITSWASTNGYVYFGHYPETQITNEVLAKNLAETGKPDGATFLYKGLTYVKENDKFYKVNPILWRVVRNDGMKLTLIADSIIDAKPFIDSVDTNEIATLGSTWGAEIGTYGDMPIADTTGKTIRTYLNSNYKTDIFEETGFISKAFNAEEQTYLKLIDSTNEIMVNPDNVDLEVGVDTAELVTLPSYRQMAVTFYGGGNWGFPDDEARSGFATHYALSRIYPEYIRESSNITAYGLKTPGTSGDGYYSYVTSNGDINSQGTYPFVTNEDTTISPIYMGIRPMISLPVEIFRYGEGTEEKPYAIKEIDENGPIIMEAELINDNEFNQDYAVNGSNLTLNLVFDKELMRTPVIKFDKYEATVEKIDDTTYVARYQITGTEDIKEHTPITVAVGAVQSLKGFETPASELECSRTIKYDVTRPKLERMIFQVGDFETGDNIVLNTRFNENVVLEKVGDELEETTVGTIILDISDESNSFQVEGLSYDFESEEPLVINKTTGIVLNHIVTEEETIVVDILSDEKILASNLQVNDLIIKDEAGNEFDFSLENLEITKTVDITRWDLERGYVYLGNYPKMKVTNAQLIEELKNQTLRMRGVPLFENVLTYNGRRYVYVNEIYYEFAPILWRVLKVDFDEIILLSEYGIEQRSFKRRNWNAEYATYGKAPISTSIGNYQRTYLNSTYISNTFENTGFLYKAFNDNERELLLMTERSDDKTNDLIYSLSESEAKNIDFGFINDNTRKTLGTEYAKNDNNYYLRYAYYYSSYISNGYSQSLVNGDGYVTSSSTPSYSDSNANFSLRPVIHIKTKDLKYGAGTKNDPWSIEEIVYEPTDNKILTVKSVSLKENTNTYQDRVKIGDTLTYDITLSRELKSLPNVTIAGKEAIVESKTDGDMINFVASYTIDGTENLNNLSVIKVTVSNCTDIAGNTMQYHEASFANKIYYDITAPTISTIITTEGIYNNEDVTFKMYLSEDMYLVREDEVGTITIDMKNPDITGITYSYNGEDSTISIDRLEGIPLKYTVLEEDLNIDIFQATSSPFENLTISGMTLVDKAGNVLDTSIVPDLIRLMKFTMWNDTTDNHGYVEFGAYPQEPVESEELIAELKKQAAEDGDVFSNGGQQYLYEGEKYYRVLPILWRIVNIEEEELTLVTDKVIDGKNMPSETQYTAEYSTYGDAPISSSIGTNIRTYLNSTYTSTDATFRQEGFLGKAFSYQERAYLITRLLSTGSMITKDMVCVPTESELSSYEMASAASRIADYTSYSNRYINSSYKNVTSASYFTRSPYVYDGDTYIGMIYTSSDSRYQGYYRQYYGDAIGIRPVIRINAENLKHGLGTIEAPYALADIDTRVPELQEFVLTNDNDREGYVKKDTTVTITFKSNEEIKNMPTVLFGNKTMELVKANDNINFEATYKVTGEEGFSDLYAIPIEVINCKDAYGNTLDSYIPTCSETLLYDVTLPMISEISVLSKEYKDGDVLNFHIRFSEDTILVKKETNASLSLDMKNPDIEGITFTYTNDEDEYAIREQDGMTLNYETANNETITIDIYQDSDSIFENPILNDLEIVDKAGNHIDLTELPKLFRVFDIKRWDQEGGYVEYGRYPQEKVTSERLKAELKKQGAKNGTIITYDKQEYLYEDNEYFMVKPILWRVMYVNATTLTLMAEHPLEAYLYSYYSSTWGTVTGKAPFKNGIGLHPRNYLNSSFEGTNFRNSGFLYKAFSEDEREELILTSNDADTSGKKVLDKVFLLQDTKYASSDYGMNTSDARVAYATDYAYINGKNRTINSQGRMLWTLAKTRINTNDYKYYATVQYNGDMYSGDPQYAGLRPMITLSATLLKYGTGTQEDPYRPYLEDLAAPRVEELVVEYETETEGYGGIDTQIDIEFKFDEPISNTPIVEVGGFRAILTPIDAQRFKASYKIIGNEGFEQGKYINIVIHDAIDFNGNYLQSYSVPDEKLVIYDTVDPYIEQISVRAGSYENETVMNFLIRFSEDVKITRTNSDGSFKFDLLNNGLEGISYNYPSDDENDTLIVSKEDGIVATYTVNGELIEVTTEREISWPITNIALDNLRIYDYASNELIIPESMVLARILDVVEYDELGNGYIDFGTYPQKRITDTKLISELNALIIKNGEAFNYYGNQYLYEGGVYYQIEPILWRVLSNDGITLTLQSDKVLESRKFTNSYEKLWSNEYLNYAEAPIARSTGNGIRTYLNSTYKSGVFRTSGFMQKAFNQDELNAIRPGYTESASDSIYQDVKTYDMISILGYDELPNDSTKRRAKITEYGQLRNGYLGSGYGGYYTRTNSRVETSSATYPAMVTVDNTGARVVIQEEYFKHDAETENKFFGIRPVVKIYLRELQTGNGKLDNPFSIKPEEPAPEVDLFKISSNNMNPSWAMKNNVVTAVMTFSQVLSKDPIVLIAGKEAEVSKNSDAVYTATYTITGEEDLLEYDEIELVVQQATNLKGYMADDIKPVIEKPIYFDCTSPLIDQVIVTADTYNEGDEIPFTIHFTEDVNISLLSGSVHKIVIGFNELKGEGAVFELDSSIRGTSTLNGKYTVLKGDETIDLTIRNIMIDGVKVKDSAGNPLEEENIPELFGTVSITTKDVIPTISSNVGTKTESDEIIYTVDFGKNVTGFTNSNNDITVTNGTITNFIEKNNGTYNYYEISVKATNRNEMQVITINKGACKDIYGNESLAGSYAVEIQKIDLSDEITISDANFVYDKTSKTVSVSGLPLGVSYEVKYEGMEGTDYPKQLAGPISAGNYRVYVSVLESDNLYGGLKVLEPMVIAPIEIEVIATVNDKVADGSSAAEVILQPKDITKIKAGDNVTFTYESANFENADEGINKLVVVEGIKSENPNYIVRPDAINTTGNIISEGYDFEFNSMQLVYNGLTQIVEGTTEAEGATFIYSYSKDGEVVSEIKDAGVYLATTTIIIDGIERASKTATIEVLPKPLEIIVNAEDKVYDGNNRATASLTVNGICEDDTCDVTFTKANFIDKEVGIDKVVEVHGITCSNYNYKVPAYTEGKATIIALDKLSNVVSNISNDTMVYLGDAVTLTHEKEEAKIWYTLNESEEALYVSRLVIDEDSTITAYATLSGYDNSDVVTFNYLIRTWERILEEMNKDNATGETASKVLANNKDISILEVTPSVLEDYKELTDDLKTKVCENVITKYTFESKTDFSNKLKTEIDAVRFEEGLGDIEDLEKEDIDVADTTVLKQIEDAKIAYEKLGDNVKQTIDDVLINKIDELYNHIIEQLTHERFASDFEIIGLATKFDTENSENKKLKLLVEVNEELKTTLLSKYKSTNLLNTVDIKILKELSEEEILEIQPDENKSVIIKLEVPYALKDKLFKVYHLKNSEVLDVSTEVANCWTETTDEKLYVLFEAESFSNYVIVYENQYKVTIESNGGGTVTPNGTMNVSQGKDILLNLDAIEGYIIKDIIINSKKYTTKRSDSDTFLIENINEDTTVTVNFALKDELIQGGGSGGSGGSSGGGGGGGSYQKPETIVEQVPTSPTHKAYMQGYNDGTFKPKGNITRAEVATILAKVSKDFDETKTYNVNFTDAENGRWYSNYVGYCYEKEILVGYKDGSFKPNENITRSEYAAAIVRMTNVILLEGASKFADANNTWFEKYVYTLEKYNLVDGYPDGSFGSYDNITRAEATKMLNSILGRSPNKLKVQTQGYMTTEFSDVVLTSWYAYDVIEATNEHIFDNHH